jgi:hypothetical protein
VRVSGTAKRVDQPVSTRRTYKAEVGRHQDRRTTGNRRSTSSARAAASARKRIKIFRHLHSAPVSRTPAQPPKAAAAPSAARPLTVNQRQLSSKGSRTWLPASHPARSHDQQGPHPRSGPLLPDQASERIGGWLRRGWCEGGVEHGAAETRLEQRERSGLRSGA